MKNSIIPQIESLIWIILGSLLCIESVGLGIGTIYKPGSGFTPFITGSLLVFLGLLLALYKFFLKHAGKAGDDTETPMKMFGKKWLFSLIVLWMYVLCLETLGFFVATLVLLFFLFKILEPKEWFKPILISFIAVILCYMIFHAWLRINFPKGMLM